METLLVELRDLQRGTRDLLLPPENLSLIVSADSTRWTTTFFPPLFLDPQRKYELAMVNLETYNSIPNVTSAVNTFVYGKPGEWKTITLPEGSYELAHINREIQRQLEGAHVIELGANPSTLKAFLKIYSPDTVVDMAQSSIRALLGFEPRALGQGYHEGENPVDIISVNSILVHSNLVSGSYVNGRPQPVVYSFFPDVCPGYKILEAPKNLVYLPVSQTGQVSTVDVWLTDQNGDLLNLRGETITIRLHIRSASR